MKINTITMKTILAISIVFLFQYNILAKDGYSKQIDFEFYSVKPADTAALENANVRVMQNIAECGDAHTPGFGKRIIVALEELKIEANKGEIKLKRGDVAVFQEDESYKIPGGRFFEVAIKKDHPAYLGPDEWLEPVKNKVVYDDDQLRIFEEVLAAGDTRPLHSHAQRVVVRLNPARLTDPTKNPGKNKDGSLQVPNTVKFAEPMVHVVQNISEVPLFNIIIEFKYQ